MVKASSRPQTTVVGGENRRGMKIRSPQGNAGSSPAIGRKTRRECPWTFALPCVWALFMPPLVLASASPRRSQLLRDLGLQFTIAPTDAPEPAPTREDGAHPSQYVERLAQLKAGACDKRGLIIAADTVVVFQNEVLNKPLDADDAVQMLRRLRGQTHRVLTGVCLRLENEYWCEHEETRVTFGNVSDEWIGSYVATGEPLDKAGAYGAQGRGALLVEHIEGDYFNVVGLPLFRLAKMLGARGFEISTQWKGGIL